jgi:transposase-like protein
MRARQFEQFLQRLSSLTRRQRTRLLTVLQSAAGLDRALNVIDHHNARPICPRCQADNPYRHGHAHGLQRYRCRVCSGTFNALSGTPLARLRHKARWLDYLDGMLDSHSVRRIADQLDVASTTSFRWRHRFLALAKDDRPIRLSGIAEADEMYVLESHKGSRSLPRPPRRRGGKATKRGISSEQMCILVNWACRTRRSTRAGACARAGPCTSRT